MSDERDPIARIAHAVRPVLQRYGVRRAVLFGSFARGRNSRRSDVDLIVIKDTEQRFFARYDGLLQELQATLLPHDVDLLIYTPQEFEAIKHRSFIARALGEGRVIYEH